ncbi:hypothetical protein ABK040_010276 [Willaertia magna]
MNIIHKIDSENEKTWMKIGKLAESMSDSDKAIYAYENALRFNKCNVQALTSIALIYRMKDPPDFPRAVEYYHSALNTENNNAEIWGNLGHCFLMMDDLPKAYTAYHQAIYNAKLQNKTKQDPHLWYGIGILYERYSSLENAEEAFRSVLKMDKSFEKINEIYFRLGIIYKQQKKYEQSLECFGHILKNPPAPLTEADIWFQIGHVYELQKNFQEAKKSYETVLKFNPNHSKVLQQLGWLYHQNTEFQNQDVAIHYLQRSIDADANSGQTWYLLGRCFMALKKYKLAYNAYQQAVFREGKNPTFWCSIGVLYYQINQYRDALDAYSRAIRLNPYLSEVWYDLGTLYESCNQIPDALDAYQRAADLDSNNEYIQQRLMLLKNMERGTGSNPEEAGRNLAPIHAVEPPAQQNGQPTLSSGFFPNTVKFEKDTTNAPIQTNTVSNMPNIGMGNNTMPPHTNIPNANNTPSNMSNNGMGNNTMPQNIPPSNKILQPPHQTNNYQSYPPPNPMVSTSSMPPVNPKPVNSNIGSNYAVTAPPPTTNNPPYMPPLNRLPSIGERPPSTVSNPPLPPTTMNTSPNVIPPYRPPENNYSIPPPSNNNNNNGELKRKNSPTQSQDSETKRLKEEVNQKGAESDEDDEDENEMVIHDPEDTENNHPKIVGTTTDTQKDAEDRISSPHSNRAKSRFVRKKTNDSGENSQE